MADIFPVDQIPAVPDGNAGEKFKGAGYQVVVLPYPADAGIGIKAGNDGISVSTHTQNLLWFSFIVTGIPGDVKGKGSNHAQSRVTASPPALSFAYA